MEVEIFTIKEKRRFVEVQSVTFLERTVCIERKDENKFYFFPLINVVEITVEDGEMSKTGTWYPKDTNSSTG